MAGLDVTVSIHRRVIEVATSDVRFTDTEGGILK